MRQVLRVALFASVGLGASLVLAGCEGAGGHKMTTISSGPKHEMMCKACYDEVKVFRRGTPKASWSRNQIIRTHHCRDCGSDVTLYTQDGVPMDKCSSCAPEGVACDKCVPPKAKP